MGSDTQEEFEAMNPFQRQELTRVKMIVDQLLKDPAPHNLPGAFRFDALCHEEGFSVSEIRSHRRPAELVEARARIAKKMHKEGFSIRALCKLMERTNKGIKNLLRKK